MCEVLTPGSTKRNLELGTSVRFFFYFIRTIPKVMTGNNLRCKVQDILEHLDPNGPRRRTFRRVFNSFHHLQFPKFGLYLLFPTKNTDRGVECISFLRKTFACFNTCRVSQPPLCSFTAFVVICISVFIYMQPSQTVDQHFIEKAQYRQRVCV